MFPFDDVTMEYILFHVPKNVHTIRTLDYFMTSRIGNNTLFKTMLIFIDANRRYRGKTSLHF